GEIGLAGWMLSGRHMRLCAVIQTIALLSMNVLELRYAQEKLLWPATLIPANLVFLALVWWIALTKDSANTRPHACPLTRALRRHPIPVNARFDHALV